MSFRVSVLLAVALSVGPICAEQMCVDELESRYGTEYSEALYGHPTNRRTLLAEKGSLAERHPEVLSELARMYRLVRFRERGMDLLNLQQLAHDLEFLQASHPDVGLNTLLEPIQKRVEKILNVSFLEEDFEHGREAKLNERERRLTRFPHLFAEVVVNSMLHGELHRPNVTLSAMHPSLEETMFGEREMDLVTREADGRERWIEYKNWRRQWYRGDEGTNMLITQSLPVNLARRQLDQPELVQRELILRHSMPQFLLEDLKSATGYDRIHFLYLDNPEDPTPYSFK